METEIEKVLYTKEEIESRVSQLAEEVDQYYRNDKPVLLGVLKGCCHFISDLSRAMRIHHSVDFISVQSYENTESTGEIKILSQPKNSITQKHVLVVEDILDTGITLSQLVPYLESFHPKSIRLITLLEKPANNKTKINADWVGFIVHPPQFVIGYGLDYNELFRNLPYIAVPNHETILKYYQR